MEPKNNKKFAQIKHRFGTKLSQITPSPSGTISPKHPLVRSWTSEKLQSFAMPRAGEKLKIENHETAERSRYVTVGIFFFSPCFCPDHSRTGRPFFILENASECSILCIFQNKKSTLNPKTFRQAKSTKSVPNYRNFFFTKKCLTTPYMAIL